MVDLDQVGFIDSVGLAVLVGTANRAATHGCSLQIACAPPKIRKLLARTLDEALEAQAAARAKS